MARIVIVDDDELVADIVIEAMTAAGHMTSAIYDGASAVVGIRESAPDLVILDYNLPGITGMEILRQVRLSPHAADMPVMMLTARSGRILKARAEQTGADDYLVKPFAPDELVQRVEALLKGRSISQAVSQSAHP